MQRWIVFGLVTMALMLGGAGLAYKIYKGNRPAPIWVPMPLNPELPEDKRAEIAQKLKTHLTQPQILLQVSKDLGLPKALNVSNDEQAANEIAKRIFVDLGEADSTMGTKVPSINVGLRGKAKDKDLTGKIAVRLIDDVRKVMGMKPAP